jgi:hypothetical protein
MTRFQRAFVVRFVLILVCCIIVNLYWHRTSKTTDGLGQPFSFLTRFDSDAAQGERYEFDAIGLAEDVVIGVAASASIAIGLAFLHILCSGGQASPVAKIKSLT